MTLWPSSYTKCNRAGAWSIVASILKWWKEKNASITWICSKRGCLACQKWTKSHIPARGSNHTGFKCDPARYISNFAGNEYLSKQDSTPVKAYFVKVWAGIKSNTTITRINDLRKETYTSFSTTKGIDALPPTGSVVHGHIRYAYFLSECYQL